MLEEQVASWISRHWTRVLINVVDVRTIRSMVNKNVDAIAVSLPNPAFNFMQMLAMASGLKGHILILFSY